MEQYRRWPCEQIWQPGSFEWLVLGSHVGTSLTGILNGPKSDKSQVLTSEASLLVTLEVDCATVLNAVLWVSGGSVYKV